MTIQRVCPDCGQSDRTDKVSTLYLMGIGGDKLPPGDAEPRAALNIKDLPPEELRRLGRRLKPPAASKRAPARPLHPDLVVATFSLILPLFLFRIYQTQPSVLLPVLAFLAALYGVYFWQRKKVIARFERQVQAGKASDERIRAGIERWMRLYYCQRDDCVFEPGKQAAAPADELMAFLLRE